MQPKQRYAVVAVYEEPVHMALRVEIKKLVRGYGGSRSCRSRIHMFKRNDGIYAKSRNEKIKLFKIVCFKHCVFIRNCTRPAFSSTSTIALK